jgi:hypothetical protein
VPMSAYRRRLEILAVIYDGLDQLAERRGVSLSGLVDAWLYDRLREEAPDLAPSTETLRYAPSRARRRDLHPGADAERSG